MFQMNKSRAIECFFKALCEDNPCVKPDCKDIPEDLLSMADSVAEYYILEMTPSGTIPLIHRVTNIPQDSQDPDPTRCSRHT